MSKNVFARVEQKYLVREDQARALTQAFAGRMEPDAYSDYTIANLYYDTEEYSLIRRSLEKPVYKEKLRLRGYGRVTEQAPVFLELKKKYRGIVHKRRITLPYGEVPGFFRGGYTREEDAQIIGEINWFLSLYALSPKVYLRYRRNAWRGVELPGLRLTLDRDIRFRQQELRLDKGDWGTRILPAGTALMEIKADGAYPLWLSRALSDLSLYPTSFSKYGRCYSQHILPAKLAGQEVRTSA